MSPEEGLLAAARENVASVERALAKDPTSMLLSNLLKTSKDSLAGLEKSLGIVPAQPAAASQPSLEQRVAAIEQQFQAMAPAISQEMQKAAEVGAAIMAALGASMSQEQAAWVQQRLNSSPQFFASPACKAAIDLFLQEWQDFERSK